MRSGSGRFFVEALTGPGIDASLASLSDRRVVHAARALCALHARAHVHVWLNSVGVHACAATMLSE